jgi:hypothetical protein
MIVLTILTVTGVFNLTGAIVALAKHHWLWGAISLLGAWACLIAIVRNLTRPVEDN